MNELDSRRQLLVSVAVSPNQPGRRHGHQRAQPLAPGRDQVLCQGWNDLNIALHPRPN